MLLTIYLDQVAASESGINKHPLFFLSFFKRDKEEDTPFCEKARSVAHINPEDDALPSDRPDVAREVGLDSLILTLS